MLKLGYTVYNFMNVGNKKITEELDPIAQARRGGGGEFHVKRVKNMVLGNFQQAPPLLFHRTPSPRIQTTVQ